MISKIETENAPKAIGPYSQAVRAGDFIFASGVLPLHPETGEMKKGGIEAQTEQIFDNIRGLLLSCNLSLGSVVKMNVYLKDMNDFQKMNQVYGKVFGNAAVFPARSTVEVARLPKDALIEIEFIASVK